MSAADRRIAVGTGQGASNGIRRVSIFFTDYSITPAVLAVALEKCRCDSVWATEHSHIPAPRKTPGPGRRRPAQALLRCDGPVRRADRGGRRHQEAQNRDRHRAGDPARYDPDREARRLDWVSAMRFRS